MPKQYIGAAVDFSIDPVSLSRVPHNHAQTARNLKRSLRNAAAGARLIQAEGLDSKSAADIAASVADALEELHRLQRSLDRRIRCDKSGRRGPDC
jgi:hypothetical protein